MQYSPECYISLPCSRYLGYSDVSTVTHISVILSTNLSISVNSIEAGRDRPPQISAPGVAMLS